jgi:hypothetical protein
VRSCFRVQDKVHRVDTLLSGIGGVVEDMSYFPGTGKICSGYLEEI